MICPAGRVLILIAAAASIGCHSPYYADQGALAGGLGGAGLGAIIGSATGHAGAGAAIGAAAGALTGGAVGGALDDIDAKNRAQIAAATRHPPSAVSVNDVIAMSRSGVDEQLIVNQLASNGLQRPVQANDVIYMQQNGVSPHVISVAQQTRVAAPGPPGAVVVPAGPPAVVVADPYYGPGYYRPYYGPRVAWGVSVAH
jgi:hypothetical protein